MNGDARNTIHAIVILSYANKSKDRPARLLMRFLWWRRIIAFKLNFCPQKYVFKRFFFLARDDQRFCQNYFQKGPIVKNVEGVLMEHWNLINVNTMKMAVSVFWITSILGGVFSAAKKTRIVFVASAYVILYLETSRHQKKIKAEQLPRQEEERCSKESRVLMTPMFVVVAVVVCRLPFDFCLIV